MYTTHFSNKHAHNGKGGRIIIKISVALFDMLLKLDPEKFKGYVVYENRRKSIYVVVLREIYGILVAPLLWYQKFKKYLIRMDLCSITIIFM